MSIRFYYIPILNFPLLSVEPKPEASSSSNASTGGEAKKRKKTEIKEWYEAVSPEGYTYYWSTTTGGEKG